MLVLHQFQTSPFCDKIRRLLHWKGLAYRIEEVPLARAPSVRRRNPAGKLPVLEHDGRMIGDSTDIAYYLEDRFPEPPVLPADPAERALCHVLEDWADESLYFYEMTLRFTLPHNARRFLPELVHADAAPVRALARFLVPSLLRRTTRAQGIGRKSESQLRQDLQRQVSALAGLLGGRSWLVGESLSLADLAVFAQLDCIRRADEGVPLLASQPVVDAWCTRVDEATRAPRA